MMHLYILMHLHNALHEFRAFALCIYMCFDVFMHFLGFKHKLNVLYMSNKLSDKIYVKFRNYLKFIVCMSITLLRMRANTLFCYFYDAFYCFNVCVSDIVVLLMNWNLLCISNYHTLYKIDILVRWVPQRISY